MEKKLAIGAVIFLQQRCLEGDLNSRVLGELAREPTCTRMQLCHSGLVVLWDQPHDHGQVVILALTRNCGEKVRWYRWDQLDNAGTHPLVFVELVFALLGYNQPMPLVLLVDPWQYLWRERRECV